MSLLSDLKLTAQILGLVILITTLVLALRKFTTNNMGSASLTLAEGNVTSSSQDNIQMIALNINPVWAPIWRMYSDPHARIFFGLFELRSLNCLRYEVCSLLLFFCTLFFLQNLCCVDLLYFFFFFFFLLSVDLLYFVILYE